MLVPKFLQTKNIILFTDQKKKINSEVIKI